MTYILGKNLKYLVKKWIDVKKERGPTFEMSSIEFGFVDHAVAPLAIRREN